MLIFSCLSVVAVGTSASPSNKLLPGQKLKANADLMSSNGLAFLYMQGDGNLVLRNKDHKALWSSHTDHHKNVTLELMENGNLVLISGSGILWQTHTTGATSAQLQNNCNFVVYNESHALWASNSSCETAPTPAPPPTPQSHEPKKYILSFPTNDNPLNISVSADPSKNYIILLGDWGSPGKGSVQRKIAEKMVSFYNKQKEKGYNLLFVGLVGDNFYNSGQDCTMYIPRWIDMYGEIATNYTWLSVMGNHDWGIHDHHAACAWGVENPHFIDPVTKIPYDANQINPDKGGCNPSNYYLPDFGYYYTIPELNFEWIALEESGTKDGKCRAPMGKQDWADCGHSSTVGCTWLAKIANASEEMMRERARVSRHSNFIISQHYPAPPADLLKQWSKARDSKITNDTVWTAYGHIHEQKCTGMDSNGACNQIMSGGGGGCCTENTRRGFYVIGFDKDKRMTQPYSFDDSLISCMYPCGAEMTDEEIIEVNFNACCHTPHGEDCHLLDLSQC